MPRGKNKGIHINYRKDRNCWEIREFNQGNRKRHATGFSSRKDAEERLAEIILEKSNPIKNEQEITLGELLAYYVKEHVPTLSRPDTALKAIERLAPFWGNLKLEDIRTSKSKEYVEYRKKEFNSWQKNGGYKTKRTLTDQTVRREIEQLQAAINYAYKDNIITINPYVWKPQKSKAKTLWLTNSEAAALLRTAKNYPRVRDYLPLFILIGLHTGARSEAILNLTWTDINFETNRIDFSTNNKHNKRGANIPIPRQLRHVLIRHRKRGVETGHVIHRDQQPIKSVKTSWASVCKEAGLEEVTPHTMRHTAASWRMQQGVPPALIAKYLGHTTSQMVENTYGHLAPDHLENVANFKNTAPNTAPKLKKAS